MNDLRLLSLFMGGCCSRGWLWCRGWREKTIDRNERYCRICEIISRKEDMFYEDDEFYVFRDQFPSAKQHFLIVPKQHIPCVYSLLDKDRKEASHIVQRMYDIAQETIANKDNSTIKFGFHLPPGISISHLHLHAFELPHLSILKSFKYIPNSCFFVSPNTILHHLHSSS